MSANVIHLPPRTQRIREAELQEMRRRIMERVADLHDTLKGECEGRPFDHDNFRDQVLAMIVAIDSYFSKDHGLDD